MSISPPPAFRSLKPFQMVAATRAWLAAMYLGVLSMASWGQGAIGNGEAGTGTLATGASDSWTFTAAAGGSIFVRVGATNFTPRIQLFGPDNAPIDEVTAGNSFARDGHLLADATSAGTYTVLVSAAFGTQAGSYGFHVAVAPGSFTVTPGDDGGELPNGASQAATLTLGDLDLWSFTATAGDGVMIRMGSASLTPWLQLYGPSGGVVTNTTSGNSFARDGVLNLVATETGTYTLVASAAFAGQIGDYIVNMARAPGAIVVSPEDQGGPLENGAVTSASLVVGDLDVWSFDAAAGDGLMLRVGADNDAFTPWVQLYGPAGNLVTNTLSGNSFARDGFLNLSAPETGTYTLVVSATYSGQSGDYTLHLAKAPGAFVVSPGDQGGPMENGAVNSGNLIRGDLDLWSFDANAGDGLMLRVGAAADAFTPWLQLYGPTGALVTNTLSGNSFARDGVLNLSAPDTGTYTLVVSATYPGQAGDYTLHLARAPGAFVISPDDQGGPMENGASNSGNLIIGDLDLWSFEADSGDGLMLRAGATTFTPWLQLYGPSGNLVTNTISGNSFARDGVLTLSAPETGSYTLVLSATYPTQVGDYTVGFAKSPGEIVVSEGDEGGSLTNAFHHTAAIANGDLDLWSFIGTPGDSNVLTVTATNFTPWIRLYGPDGALLRETTSGNSFARKGVVNLTITNAGTYNLFVSATYPAQTGGYDIRQSRVPPDLIVPDTVVLDESMPLAAILAAQDPDAPAKPLQFQLLSAPVGPTLTLVGPTNATIAWATTEADGPSTNVIVATVTDVVNGKEFIRTNSFTVVVNEVNTAPQLTVPSDQALDEATPLHVSASATDADVPANPLTFSLVSPPDGMTIDVETGAIDWTPTEAQGPSTNTITVVVTDDNPPAVNAVHLSVTNQFTVVVREINQPPQLTPPGNQTLAELGSLAVQAMATDPDMPANPLVFSLAAPPAGMTIDPATGAIAWTPTEAQGPSTNVVMVVVSDASPFAANATTLSVTNAFTVVVSEVNAPPVLTVPADQMLAELTPLAVSVSATDSDVPANPLIYSLLASPSGMTLDTATGAIAWTPTEAQGPSTNIVTVVVTDDNAAAGGSHLSITNSFNVVVTEVNLAPVLEPIASQSVHFNLPVNIQAVATDEDLPANTLTYSLEDAPAGMTVNAATGAVTWTPTESQVGQYTVTLKAGDGGSPVLTASTAIQITVTGEGAQLAITRQGDFVEISANGDTGVQYELEVSADLVTWERLTDFQLDTPPYRFIDPNSGTGAGAPSVRFYRLLLIPQ